MKLQSLRDLEIFQRTVDGGSLRSAAEALNLSPAVISRRISSLEQTLGVTLLVRSTRSLHVTPRGEVFYRRCVALLNQARDAERELSSPDSIEGTLRVVVPTGFAFPRYLKALGSLLEAHPAMQVELYLSDHPPDPRRAGMDVVVRPGNQADSTLLTRRLGTVQMVMMAAPTYLAARGRPSVPNDLLDHQCLRFRSERQQDVWRLTAPDGVTQEVPLGGSFFSDNSHALGEALYAGLGIGFREVSEARDAFERGALEYVLPDHTTDPIGIYATYPRENADSRAVRVFLDMVVNLLGPSESRSSDT